MRPLAVAVAVASVLVIAQVVLFAGLRSAPHVLPVLVQSARPFLIERIPNGTTLSQQLNLQGNDLETIELSGTVASPTQSGSIDATLVELSGAAAERQVRSVNVRASDPCCTIAFEPVRNSAGGGYRLDLKIRDFEPSAPLSLEAVLMERGGLTINGRPQAARLTFSGSATRMTAIARLRNISPQGRLSLGGLIALLIALDAAIACGAAGLVRVFATPSD